MNENEGSGIPPHDASGDLPPGIYVATLAQVAARFGSSNSSRILLQNRVERIYRLAERTGQLRRFILFGSYVTAKPAPNDIDVFMIMSDEFDSTTASGEARILFDHSGAQAHFGASVFWVRRVGALGGEDEAVSYWQTTRSGGLRGIIEVMR